MLRRLLLLLAFSAGTALAQTSTITASVVDPNGNVYANGTVSTQLIGPSGATIKQSGVPFQPLSSGPFLLNSAGFFSLTLTNNSALSPSGTVYIFTICGTPVNIGPSTQPTPTQVCFQSAPITISASADISGQLNASALVLGPRTGGTPLWSAIVGLPAACPAGQAINALASPTNVCITSGGAFGTLLGGTNTGQTMLVGSGSSLDVTGTGTNTATGVRSTVPTGQVYVAINGAPGNFLPVAIPWGNGGAQISTGTYLIQCDTATVQLDRATELEGTTTSTFTLPDPGVSGCGNFIFGVQVNSGTVTVQRQTAATFAIYNGSTFTAAATSFSLTAGQWATVFTPDNSHWTVHINSGGAGGITGLTNNKFPIATSSTTIGDSNMDYNITNPNGITTTATQGIYAKYFHITTTTATFRDFGAGPTSLADSNCNVVNTWCEQAPTSISQYSTTVPGAAPVSPSLKSTDQCAGSPPVCTESYIQTPQPRTITSSGAITSTTLAALTGPSWNLYAGQQYTLDCAGFYQVSSLTGSPGLALGSSGTATATSVNYWMEGYTSTSVDSSGGIQTALAAKSFLPAATVATTNFPWRFHMVITVNAAGTWILSVANLVGASSSVTVGGGSCVLQ